MGIRFASISTNRSNGMLTSLLEISALWLPIVGALAIVGGYSLFALFLYTLTETLNKVRADNRNLSANSIRLNLLPGFNFVWLFITVSRLASSVQKELRTRGEDRYCDGGRRLGLGFAMAAGLSLVPGLNLLAIPVAILLWVRYWSRMIQFGKRLENPGETIFLERYNARLEFPTSLAIAALSFLLLVVVGILVLPLFVKGPDRSSIPILSLDVGGNDEFGDGWIGSGGDTPDPLRTGRPPTDQDLEVISTAQIPRVQDDLRIVLEQSNSTASDPISPEKQYEYSTLDEALRKKLLGLERGKGPHAGKGVGPQPGPGDGGSGADSTRARSLRWILRFRTLDGKDYLLQLRSLGATVLVPLTTENKHAYIFRNLDNPTPGPMATDADYAILSKQIQFSDFRRESCRQVGEALNLDFVPIAFWAFFPRSIEEQLARLEVAYRNRRPKDIAETVFQVTVRSGQYQLVVTEQKAK